MYNLSPEAKPHRCQMWLVLTNVGAAVRLYGCWTNKVLSKQTGVQASTEKHTAVVLAVKVWPCRERVCVCFKEKTALSVVQIAAPVLRSVKPKIAKLVPHSPADSSLPQRFNHESEPRVIRLKHLQEPRGAHFTAGLVSIRRGRKREERTRLNVRMQLIKLKLS